MQFQTCGHGNIAMTCSKCRGRQVAAPAAPRQSQGSGFSEARALMPDEAAPGEHSVDDLYDQTTDLTDRFNIMMGVKLGEIVDRGEKHQLKLADQQAREYKRFWQQIHPSDE